MPQAVADLGRYYSDTAKQADREIAGMQANLRKGPAVARYEGEVDEAAPGWLSDYMRTQENGEKSLEKRFGTIPEQNMADAARSMEPFPYRYKAQYAPPDQAPGEVNIGPMANQMARDPVASTAIVRDPGTGKLAIDQGKGLKLVMGSLGAMQQQIDALRARSAARRRGDTAQP
jgi:hypothetical protein